MTTGTNDENWAPPCQIQHCHAKFSVDQNNTRCLYNTPPAARQEIGRRVRAGHARNKAKREPQAAKEAAKACEAWLREAPAKDKPYSSSNAFTEDKLAAAAQGQALGGVTGHRLFQPKSPQAPRAMDARQA